MDLILPLKGEYFDQIKSGIKTDIKSACLGLVSRIRLI